MSDGILSINDIEDIGLKLEYNLSNSNVFKEIVKTMKVADYKIVKVNTINILELIEKDIPSLIFSGEGFNIRVTYNKIELQLLQSVNVDENSLSIDVIEKDDRIKILSKDNLSAIETDLNFIVGFILGKLNINTENVTLQFKMLLRKDGKFKEELQRLLTSEAKILIGNPQNLDVNDIGFKIEEHLDGIKINSRYSFSVLDKPETNVLCSIIIDSKYTGTIDLHKFINTALKRINTMITKLTGGIEVV